MAEPNEEEQYNPTDPTGQVKSRRRYYMKKNSGGKWQEVGAPEPDWIGRLDTSVREFEEVIYDSGEVWVSEYKDGQIVDQYLDEVNPQLATSYRSSQKQQEDNWLTGNTTQQYLLRQKPDGKIERVPNPNYVPPRESMGATRAPRYPDEEEYAQLRNEEMRQKLGNPYTQKMKYIQQAYDKINELQQMQIRGEITAKDADQQIKGFQDWIQADMMGATPFQMQKDKRDFNYGLEKDKQDLAHKVLNTRAQTGSSMAQGLMNSLFGAYGKMYSGANPNYDIDYFGMTKALTDEYTGGQDLNQLGLQILKGALGQGGQ